MIPTKVLISGGWGYGNLGDDAILLSTIKLVRTKFPIAEIVVMSYDCENSKKAVDMNDISIIPSIHRYMVGNRSFHRFQKIKLKENYIFKLFSFTDYWNRILNRYNRYAGNRIYNMYARVKFDKIVKDPSLLPFYKAFSSADLFIQAGGGYFNGFWIDKAYSNILELIICNKLGIKSIAIGQTFGPFIKPRLKDLAIQSWKLLSVVSVRDCESFKELKAEGINPVLIPDTALSDVDFNFRRELLVTVVVGDGGMNNEEVNVIVHAISKIAKGNHLSVQILVTRLWIADVRCATILYKAFRQNDTHNVKLTIPACYNELQEYLGKSRIIVSQNLHGLILGWRAGVAGVCLNGGRKFAGFMKQSGQLDLHIPIQTISEPALFACVNNAINESDYFTQTRCALAEEVRQKFLECLDIDTKS